MKLNFEQFLFGKKKEIRIEKNESGDVINTPEDFHRRMEELSKQGLFDDEISKE